jgi:hypothetical protein
MAHDQAAAADAQRQIQLDQRLANELDASIAARLQRIEDLAIEDESAIDAPPRRSASQSAA